MQMHIYKCTFKKHTYIHIKLYTYIYMYYNGIYRIYIDILVECLPFLFKWIKWHLTEHVNSALRASAKSRSCCALQGSKDLEYNGNIIASHWTTKVKRWLKWWHSKCCSLYYCNAGTYIHAKIDFIHSNSNIRFALPASLQGDPSCSLFEWSYPVSPASPRFPKSDIPRTP